MSRYKYSHRDVIEKLGGMCARCKARDPDLLQVHHVNGNGSAERRSIGQQQGVYRRVMQGKPGYECRCANCNWKERVREGHHGGRQAREVTDESLEEYKATIRKHLVWLLEDDEP